MRRFLSGLILSLLVLLAGCQTSGFFGPVAGLPAPPGEIIRRATPLTFAQLNENPGAYQDQVIRISGSYLKLPPPVCSPQRGPLFAWSLADLVLAAGDWLRIDAQGFEDVIWLVPEGTAMTVEGYWRLYEGPLGCSKNAPREAVWYLEVLRIVEPNPLPSFAGAGSLQLTPGITAGGLDIQIVPLATLTPGGTVTATAVGTPTPSMTPALTGTLDPLETPALTMTATATLQPGITPTITPTPTVTTTPGAAPTSGGPPPTPPPDGGYPPPPASPPGGYP